jgi:predicted dehydrogenase
MVDRPILRFGIVGSGRMARTRAANIAASPRARLVAVAARNPATGRALATEHRCIAIGSVEQLLERDDLDAVVVCTHNDAHAETAMAALSAGRHVLVEYPLALDPDQAEASLATARRRDLVLQVAYDQIWLGAHEALRTAVARAGPPRRAAMQVAWSGGHGRSPFRNVRIGGPPALVKSYYLYALLEWLGRPDRCDAAVRYAGLCPDGHYDGAIQQLVLTYPGTLAELQWLVGAAEAERRVQITLTWDATELRCDGRDVVRRDAGVETRLDLAPATWSQATLAGLERFIAAIADGVSPRPDPSVAAAAVRFGAAAEVGAGGPGS